MESWRSRVAGAVFWTELLCGACAIAWLYAAGNPVTEARHSILLIAGALAALAIFFPALRPWPVLRQNALWVITALAIQGILLVQHAQAWQAGTAWLDLSFGVTAVAACENRRWTILAGILSSIEVFAYERYFVHQGVLLSWAESASMLVLTGLLLRALQHQARIRRQLAAEREKTRTDDLTGLLNARAFEECRPAAPYALAVCHIDRFKDVNDTFGHEAGDGALVFTGRVLSEACPEGAVYRLLGKEYVVVWPGGTVQEMVHRLDAARAVLRERPLRLEEGRVVVLSLSAGVAAGGARETGAEVKVRAMAPLRAAKDAGGQTRILEEVDLLAALRIS